MKNKIIKFTIVLCISLVFLRQKSYGQTFPKHIITVNGLINDKLNIVFLPDGYQSSELNQFKTDAKAVYDGILSKVPFSNDKTRFNGFAFLVPSNVSGGGTGGVPIDNYFGSTYPLNISRALSSDAAKVDKCIADNFPLADLVIILVNDARYGGSANRGATKLSKTTIASKRDIKSVIEMACHEIGHATASLGDEYDYDFLAYDAPNKSQDGNSNSVKWKKYIGQQGVGLYPFTGNGAGWYKPHQNCEMNNLYNPFCLVCENALTENINAITSVRKLEKPKHIMIPIYSISNSSFHAVWPDVPLATKYIVQYYTDREGWSGSFVTNTNYITISGGYYAGKLKIRVRALGANGATSLWGTMPNSVDFGYKLSTPKGFNVPAAVNYGLYLSWDAVSNATKYEINSISSVNGLGSSTVSSHSYNWLYISGSVIFQVRAINAQGEYSDLSKPFFYDLPSSPMKEKGANNSNFANFKFDDILNFSEAQSGKHEFTETDQSNDISSIKEEFIIAPNPTKDIVRIYNSYNSPVSMKMFSITGQIVRELKLGASTLVHVSDLAEGVYVLKFYSLNENRVLLGHKKLIVN